MTRFLTIAVLPIVGFDCLLAEQNQQESAPVVLTQTQPKELQSLSRALSSSVPSAPTPQHLANLKQNNSLSEQSGNILQVSVNEPQLQLLSSRDTRTISNPLRQSDVSPSKSSSFSSSNSSSSFSSQNPLQGSMLVFGSEEPLSTIVTGDTGKSKQTRPIVERLNVERTNPVRGPNDDNSTTTGKTGPIMQDKRTNQTGQSKKMVPTGKDIKGETGDAFAGARTKPTTQQRLSGTGGTAVLKPIPLPNSSQHSSPIGSVGYLGESKEIQQETEGKSSSEQIQGGDPMQGSGQSAKNGTLLRENDLSVSSNPLEKETTMSEMMSESTESGTDWGNQAGDLATNDSARKDAILDKVIGGGEKQGRRLELGSTGDAFPVLTVLGGLCIVLASFFIFVLFMRRVNPKMQSQLPKEAFENIGRFALNPKLQLNLLRLGNRLILVAVTQEGTVETIAEVNNPDEVVQILGICRKLDRNSSTTQFQSVLDEFAREKTTGGFLGPELTNRSAKGSSSTLANLLAGERA
ncbi:MAG: flagellar biosynthetic protein FliO [Thermoguttaceae bacterium]